MTNSVTDILQQLKDIKQPPPVSWWPLAPGWYILLGLAIVILLVGTYYGYRYWRRARRRRKVLAEVDALRLTFAQNADKQYIASRLSIILKQVLFVAYSPQEVGGLHGEDWLLFLDKASGSSEYTQGSGRLLITAPYANQTDENLDNLVGLVKKTIKRCL